jgi:hypothetical protein
MPEEELVFCGCSRQITGYHLAVLNVQKSRQIYQPLMLCFPVASKCHENLCLESSVLQSEGLAITEIGSKNLTFNAYCLLAIM